MINWLLDKLGRGYLVGGVMWLAIMVCSTIITMHLLDDPTMKTMALDWWREIATWSFGIFGGIVGMKELKKVGVALGTKKEPAAPSKNDHSTPVQ